MWVSEGPVGGGEWGMMVLWGELVMWVLRKVVWVGEVSGRVERRACEWAEEI